jgi:hypothetical protein
MARLLRAVLPRVYRDPKEQRHYADCDDPAPEELFDQGVDSRLWGDLSAYAPDGKVLFRPQDPISHADLFETLYVAQIGLGPLFNDNPVDGRNGWGTPPDYFAQVQAEASGPTP